MIENPLRQTLHRRHALKLAGALGLGVALPLTRRDLTSSVAAQEEIWESPPDLARAAEQAKDFQTYGMPDDWANYGGVLGAFAEKYGFVLGRTDTDMTSMEEITKYDAEKANPVAVSSDIGLIYGPIAEEVGVVPPYLPPSAETSSRGTQGNERRLGGDVHRRPGDHRQHRRDLHRS